MLSIMLAFLFVFGVVGCSNNTANPVSKIEVTKAPTKTVYNIGEEFSAEGGELTVYFEDGSDPEIIPLTDERLTLTTVDTSRAGSKALRIVYSMRRTQLTVTVKPFIVSFDLGGKGEIDPIEIKKVGPINNMPSNPKADGFEFNGWYTDELFTQDFDPKADITGDTTLYAQWLSLSVTNYRVLFEYNYGIGSPFHLIRRIEEGSTVTKPADPVRRGYSFDGWFTAAEGGEVFDFNTPITAETTVYAHWTLTASGAAEEYIFEAEDLNLDDIQGVGYSSNASGAGLIMQDLDDYGASNGRVVGYLYRDGIQLEFRFVSNKATNDAKVVIRLGAEFADHHLTPDMFEIALNGTPINYGQIDITDVPNQALGMFKDFEIAVNASLLEGENILTMTVANNTPLIGGATSATAPIVDCVKITTSAVLWWNGDYDLPKANY